MSNRVHYRVGKYCYDSIKKLKENKSQNENNKIEEYKYEKEKLLSLIEDKELIKIFKDNNAILAGGCIRNVFTKSDVNDFDVYFRNADDFYNCAIELYESNYYNSGYTDKAITFSVKSIGVKNSNITIQLISFNFYNDVKDIFDNFDFTICMGAYDFKDDKFVLHKDFLKHNSQRILFFNEKTRFPIISGLRVQKYKSYGYEISKSQMIKIFLSICNLDIKNYEDLKKQIGGMYGNNLEKNIPEKKDKEFDLMDYIEDIGKNYLKHDEEDFYKKMDMNNLRIILAKISGKKIKYVEFNNKNYEILCEKKDVIPVFEEISIEEENKELYKKVDINSVIKFPIKLYKFVEKSSYTNTFRSFYRSSFEYRKNEYVIPDNIGSKNSGIYCSTIKELNRNTYVNYDKKYVVELIIEKIDYFKELPSSLDKIICKKAFVKDIIEENEFKNNHSEYNSKIEYASPF